MKRILLSALRFYRAQVSPALPPACRYSPTCSAYAIEAVERFGAWRGSIMAIRRVLACNPFSRGGYDPVPEQTRPLSHRSAH